MISVIIPFMDVFNYGNCLDKCVESLKKQTVPLQIIISKHEPERYIRKNFLLNQGFKKAIYDIIWHCDCDFTLSDKRILKRMSKRLDEVIYPVFHSQKYNKMKLADGGPLMRRSVLERHGPLDESALGISYVTFPFLNWCMENTKFQVCEDFVVNHEHYKSAKKVHHPTLKKLKSIYRKVVASENYKMFDLR